MSCGRMLSLLLLFRRFLGFGVDVFVHKTHKKKGASFPKVSAHSEQVKAQDFSISVTKG